MRLSGVSAHGSDIICRDHRSQVQSPWNNKSQSSFRASWTNKQVYIAVVVYLPASVHIFIVALGTSFLVDRYFNFTMKNTCFHPTRIKINDRAIVCDNLNDVAPPKLWENRVILWRPNGNVYHWPPCCFALGSPLFWGIPRQLLFWDDHKLFAAESNVLHLYPSLFGSLRYNSCHVVSIWHERWSTFAWT